MKYLQHNKLLPDHQSVYRAFCLTETVIARGLSDIYIALDSGDIAALALLDLSSLCSIWYGQPPYPTSSPAEVVRAKRIGTRVVHVVSEPMPSVLLSHRGDHSETTNIQFGVPHRGGAKGGGAIDRLVIWQQLVML